MTQGARKGLIKNIIARELKMFMVLQSDGDALSCQEHPEAFCIMREMSHGVLSDTFLEAYLHDLKLAEGQGRNLLAEKYTLMGAQLPVRNEDSRIRDIVVSEGIWRRKVAAQFPRCVQPEGHHEFCHYLMCELQTYSTDSLAAYSDCVKAAVKQDRNLVQERYEFLMEKLGHGSLAACEAELAAEDGAG